MHFPLCDGSETSQPYTFSKKGNGFSLRDVLRGGRGSLAAESQANPEALPQGAQKGVSEMPITVWSQLIWLLALAIASFLVTWIFTDLFHLGQAAFIGVLAVVTGALL